MTTTPGTIHLEGKHKVGQVKLLSIPKSKIINTKTGQQKGATMQAAAMARVLSERGTSIAVANNTDHVWSMARHVSESFEPLKPVPEEIRLVQDFLRTEISIDFELIYMLSRGVGVHHAGFSDEVRTLIEWLAEESRLRVLCAICRLSLY